MGFDDFFEDKHRRHGNYSENRYHDDHDNHGNHGNHGNHSNHDNHGNHDGHGYNRYSHDRRHSYHGNSDHQKWFTILEKIKTNKKLQLIVVIAGIFILLIAIGLIVALLPLIIKIFNYISQNGLQSILDGATSFIDKLWKGSGK